MNRSPSRPSGLQLAAIIAVMAAGVAAAQQVILPPNLGVPAGIGIKPSATYDAALAALAEGNFTGGLELATAEYRDCMKIGNERWIDSIAGAAVVGECHYERGDYAAAIAAYDEALALAAQHPDWLLAAQFPAQEPRPVQGRRAATWGRSGRNATPAQLPAEVPIRRQGADPQQVLQRGGALAAPFDQRVRAQEIMRALVIALYRRAEILGDLGRETPALDAVTRALARRPAPPGHWSQCWIDVALGTALWAQGKPDEAGPILARGLSIGRGLDHALTPWGLIVLGRIDLDADRAAAAAKQFEEATYAATDCGDARALEEAFRLAFSAHMLAGTRGVPATIGAAGDAIGPRDGLDVLHARLLAMRAEALAVAGDPRAATAALKEIDPRLLRGEPGRAAAGAEAAYAAALAEFAAGDIAAGDANLGKAIGLARPRSTRLFQTARLVALVAEGSGVSDRQAESLFARYLGPPAPRDFGVDPLGTLAVISSARQEAFDAWIAVAARRGVERASDAVLDPAEAARRDRWLAARPLGGRVVSAERLLAADPATLDAGMAARRAAIVAARPDLAPLLEGSARKRADLAAAALAAGRPAAAVTRTPPGATDAWTEYRGIAVGLARHVAMLAAGRDAVTVDFPPLTPAPEIRRRLAPRQLILSFHWTAQGLTGVLESRDRFVTWEVRQAAALPAEIAQLTRGMCLFDAQGPVGTDRLLASDWRGPAGRVERTLFENSRVSLAEGIDELIVVPDGWLWYVPFELLPVTSARDAGGDDGPRRLGAVCRIRYCPTRSLAVMAFQAPRLNGPVGIHAGRMARGDDAEAIAAVLARTTGAVDRAVPVVLPAAAGGPSGALVASVFDALAVFDESGGAGPAAVLVPAAAGRGGLAFAEWLAPPAKRPQVVLVPGLQTALAEGLKEKSLPTRAGDDVFLPATDLLAAGAHTAVVSRWRVGGGTCVDLMTEFLREATAAPADPPEPAAAWWRRAVDLVTAESPDLAREPRIRQQGDAALADARHPFLWAGYALIDCGPGVVPPAAGAGGPAAPAAQPPAAGAAP